MNRVFHIVLASVWVVCSAAAAPCGEIPHEGRCDGKVLSYCDSQDQLVVKPACEQCCGWNGKKFGCMACPENGTYIPECLEPSKFGCNLENTHEWVCTVDESGCIRRVFTKCDSNKICDESGTHKCTPIENVNLCGVITDTGICHDNVFKVCVDNQIKKTDCAALGKSCTKTGCKDCQDQCADGDTGCLPTGQAWACTLDASINCWVQAAKNCGSGKQCIDGICQFPTTQSDDTGSVAEGPEEPDASGTAEEKPAKSSDSGGCAVGGALHAQSFSLWLLCCLLLILWRRRVPVRG